MTINQYESHKDQMDALRMGFRDYWRPLAQDYRAYRMSERTIAEVERMAWKRLLESRREKK